MRSFKNLKGKVINRYSFEGALIGTWRSGAAAARSLDIPASRIYRCCSGKKLHTAGSVWRWAGDTFDKFAVPDIRNISDDRK